MTTAWEDEEEVRKTTKPLPARSLVAPHATSGKRVDPYPDTAESGEAYDVEIESALNLRRIARLFGLTIGVVSASFFVYVFWLLLHGNVVPLYETNTMLASGELLLASVGLAVLVGILLNEISGKLWPAIYSSIAKFRRRRCRER